MSRKRTNIPVLGMDLRPRDRQRQAGLMREILNLRPIGPEKDPTWVRVPAALAIESGELPGDGKARGSIIVESGTGNGAGRNAMATITVGTATGADEVVIEFEDGITAGPVTVGDFDTAAQVAQDLADAINSDTNIAAVPASAAGGSIRVVNDAGNSTLGRQGTGFIDVLGNPQPTKAEGLLTVALAPGQVDGFRVRLGSPESNYVSVSPVDTVIDIRDKIIAACTPPITPGARASALIRPQGSGDNGAAIAAKASVTVFSAPFQDKANAYIEVTDDQNVAESYVVQLGDHLSLPISILVGDNRLQIAQKIQAACAVNLPGYIGYHWDVDMFGSGPNGGDYIRFRAKNPGASWNGKPFDFIENGSTPGYTPGNIVLATTSAGGSDGTDTLTVSIAGAPTPNTIPVDHTMSPSDIAALIASEINDETSYSATIPIDTSNRIEIEHPTPGAAGNGVIMSVESDNGYTLVQATNFSGGRNALTDLGTIQIQVGSLVTVTTAAIANGSSAATIRSAIVSALNGNSTFASRYTASIDTTTDGALIEANAVGVIDNRPLVVTYNTSHMDIEFDSAVSGGVDAGGSGSPGQFWDVTAAGFDGSGGARIRFVAKTAGTQFNGQAFTFTDVLGGGVPATSMTSTPTAGGMGWDTIQAFLSNTDWLTPFPASDMSEVQVAEKIKDDINAYGSGFSATRVGTRVNILTPANATYLLFSPGAFGIDGIAQFQGGGSYVGAEDPAADYSPIRVRIPAFGVDVTTTNIPSLETKANIRTLIRTALLASSEFTDDFDATNDGTDTGLLWITAIANGSAFNTEIIVDSPSGGIVIEKENLAAGNDGSAAISRYLATATGNVVLIENLVHTGTSGNSRRLMLQQQQALGRGLVSGSFSGGVDAVTAYSALVAIGGRSAQIQVGINLTRNQLADAIASQMSATPAFSVYDFSQPQPNRIDIASRATGAAFNGLLSVSFNRNDAGIVRVDGVNGGFQVFDQYDSAAWYRREIRGEFSVDPTASLDRIVAVGANGIDIIDPSKSYSITFRKELPQQAFRSAVFAQVDGVMVITTSVAGVSESMTMLVDDTFIDYQVPSPPEFVMFSRLIQYDDDEIPDFGLVSAGYAIRVAWRFKDGSHSAYSAPYYYRTPIAPKINHRFSLEFDVAGLASDYPNRWFWERVIDGVTVAISQPTQYVDSMTNTRRASGVGSETGSVRADAQISEDDMRKSAMNGVFFEAGGFGGISGDRIVVDLTNESLAAGLAADDSNLLGHHRVLADVVKADNRSLLLGSSSVDFAKPDFNVAQYGAAVPNRQARIVVAIEAGGTTYLRAGDAFTITKAEIEIGLSQVNVRNAAYAGTVAYPDMRAAWFEVWAEYSGTWRRLPTYGIVRGGIVDPDSLRYRFPLQSALRSNFAWAPMIRITVPAQAPQAPADQAEPAFYGLGVNSLLDVRGDRMHVSTPLNIVNLPAARTSYIPIEPGDRIQAMASAAVELSDGQFGQYPLYVFGRRSVHALDRGQDPAVAFARITPISNSVGAVNARSVANVGRSIIFLSDHGLYAISQGMRMISEPVNPGLVPEISDTACIGINRELDADEVWVSPGGSDDTYVFNFKHQRWFVVPRNYRAMFRRDSDLYAITEPGDMVLEGGDPSLGVQIRIDTGPQHYEDPDLRKRVFLHQLRLWSQAIPMLSVIADGTVIHNGTGAIARTATGSAYAYAYIVTGTFGANDWFHHFEAEYEVRTPHRPRRILPGEP